MSSTCGVQSSSARAPLAECSESLDGEQALVDTRELRPDVEVHACNIDSEPARLVDHAQRAFRRQPNLDSSCAVRIERCVAASTPGVQADECALHSCACSSHRLVLRVEHDRDARLRSRAQLFVRLVIAMEEDAISRDPAVCANASSPSVDTSAPTPSSASTRSSADVRKRLRPVDDQSVGRGCAIRARLGADRLFAVDDERRAMLGREAARGDAAEVELTGVDASGIGKKRKHRLLVSKSR